MKREDLLPAENKFVKLVLQNDFVLRGTVDKINEEAILFSTTYESSVIDLKEIKMAIIKGGQY